MASSSLEEEEANKIFQEAFKLIERECMLPSDGYNEVVDNIFISEEEPAINFATLQMLGITHIVNCCEGTTRYHVNTGRAFYPPSMDYFGIPAVDSKTFDLMPFFEPASK